MTREYLRSVALTEQSTIRLNHAETNQSLSWGVCTPGTLDARAARCELLDRETMKIVADEKGWKLVTDTSTNLKRGSGVFAKMGDATDAASDTLFTHAETEPSPPSDAAIEQGGLRLPTAPALPADLVTLDDGSKVA